MEEQKKKLNIKDILLAISATINIGLIVWVAILATKPKVNPGEQRRPQYPLKVNVDLKELTKDGYFIGPYDAKVTLVLFNSFSCGFCKRAKDAVMQVAKNFPKDVKIVYKHFNRGNRDLSSAIAVECAGDQNKFWEMFETIFEKGADTDFTSYAQDLKINTGQFKKCMSEFKHREKTENDTQDGIRIGVRGTPSFLINNMLYVGWKPYSAMAAIIKKELTQ